MKSWDVFGRALLISGDEASMLAEREPTYSITEPGFSQSLLFTLHSVREYAQTNSTNTNVDSKLLLGKLNDSFPSRPKVRRKKTSRK